MAAVQTCGETYEEGVSVRCAKDWVVKGVMLI
jgi:hypothetical protein